MSFLDLAGISVYIEREVHPIYEELVSRSSKNAEDHPFATMKDLFMLSACVGAKNNKYAELNSSRDVFAAETFDRRTDVPVLAALAYYRTKDLDILHDSKRVVEIVQEWANGGIHIVREEVVTRPGLRPLFNLVDMIIENEV